MCIPAGQCRPIHTFERHPDPKIYTRKAVRCAAANNVRGIQKNSRNDVLPVQCKPVRGGCGITFLCSRRRPDS